MIAPLDMRRNAMIRTTLAVLLTLASPAALAQSPADKPVAVLVVVKTPPGVTRPMIEKGFEQAAPTYRQVAGLIRKYFTVNDTGFGGMYLWTSRRAAEAWFSAAWRAKAKATYGSDPEVSWFDAPVLIDNTGAH
jgi:hypothetical protein